MKENIKFNSARQIASFVSDKLQNSFRVLFSIVCAMIYCMTIEAETITVIYDPIEGGRPPRVDIVCSPQFDVSIEDRSDENLIQKFLILKSDLLNISLPLNYPAWYLINEGKITAQGENQEYTIEDSGNPEITYNISINDGVLNLTGFGEGAEVDVYDIDDKCYYLTIDYTLSIPIEEINSKRYRYVSANGVELYFD